MTTADAHFIRPLKNIEVQVTWQKTRFKAICSAFPECKGFGKSEDEAIDKLCKSVSKFISQVTIGLVENVIREARHPSEPPEAAPASYHNMVPPQLPRLSYPEDRRTLRVPAEQDIHTLIHRLQGNIDEDMSSQSEIEGFYMGFPLSLN
jgi:hypothetical protein